MRRALLFVLSVVALGQFAAFSTGCGSSGGAGGAGGGGGTGNVDVECSVDKPCPDTYRCDPDEQKCVRVWCPAECSAGYTCTGHECLRDYTLSFIDAPPKASTRVRLVLEVRPSPGVEPMEASKIEVAAEFNSVPVIPPPTLEPVEGQDNRWVMNIDVSKINTSVVSDGVPLHVRAKIKNIDAMEMTAERTVNVDNKPPDLRLEPTGPEQRRDKLINLTADVTDSNAQGTRVFAYLSGHGEKAPEPAPLGWTEGTPKENNKEVWYFTLDQRSPLATLDGQDGTLDVHLWAADLYGNAATLVVSSAVKVTRKGWDGDLGNPNPAAPVVMPDGRVAVLALKQGLTGKEMGVFDEAGVKTAVSVNNLSKAYALTIGEDGAFYITTTRTILHAALDGASLQDTPIYNCTTPSILTSKVALAHVDGEEVALVATNDNTLLAVRPDCTVVPGDTIPGASGATPAIGNSASGAPVAYIGGQTLHPTDPKRTLNVFEITAASLNRLAGIYPAQYASIKDADLALDNLTVLTFPRFDTLAASLDFTAGFDQNPGERVYRMVGVSTDAARATPSPIITSNLVIYPTNVGLRALPRKGPWSKDIIYESGKDFRSTPVAGEGDVIYAIDSTGLVHAVQYREAQVGPELHALWTTQLGDVGETYSAPLTLTCSGMLVATSEQGKVHTVVTDSRGLDPNAPWPKYQHDIRNTGNAATSNSCE